MSSGFQDDYIPAYPPDEQLANFFPWDHTNFESCLRLGGFVPMNLIDAFSGLLRAIHKHWARDSERLAKEVGRELCIESASNDSHRHELEDLVLKEIPQSLIRHVVMYMLGRYDYRTLSGRARAVNYERTMTQDAFYLEADILCRIVLREQKLGDDEFYRMILVASKQVMFSMISYDDLLWAYYNTKSISLFENHSHYPGMESKRLLLKLASGLRMIRVVKTLDFVDDLCMITVRHVGVAVPRHRVLGSIENSIVALLSIGWEGTLLKDNRSHFQSFREGRYPQSIVFDHLIMRVKIASVYRRDDMWANGTVHGDTASFRYNCRNYLRCFFGEEGEAEVSLDDWFMDIAFAVQYTNDEKANNSRGITFHRFLSQAFVTGDWNLFFHRLRVRFIVGLVHKSHNADTPGMHGYDMIPFYNIVEFPSDTFTRKRIDELTRLSIAVHYSFTVIGKELFERTYDYQALVKQMGAMGMKCYSCFNQKCETFSWVPLPKTVLFSRVSLTGQCDKFLHVRKDPREVIFPDLWLAFKVLCAMETPFVRAQDLMDNSLFETLMGHVCPEMGRLRHNMKIMMHEASGPQ